MSLPLLFALFKKPFKSVMFMIGRTWPATADGNYLVDKSGTRHLFSYEVSVLVPDK